MSSFQKFKSLPSSAVRWTLSSFGQWINCRTKGLRVTIPVPRGRIDRPTKDSMTELFPELCKNFYEIQNIWIRKLWKIWNYLWSYDDDLRQLYCIWTHCIEYILQLVDDRNQGLHIESSFQVLEKRGKIWINRKFRSIVSWHSMTDQILSK